MPVATLTACVAVFLGGLAGTLLRRHLPETLCENLPILFGFCALGIGVNSVIKAHSMTAVVLAVLMGFVLGQLMHLEHLTSRFFHWLVQFLHLGGDDIDMEFYITAVALFCCSGFGWYGVLSESMTGDGGILFSKAVLDFFTALVFSVSLGSSICAIPLLQVVIFLLVFGVGKLLVPFVTPEMFADLSGCGGILTLAAAMRVSRIKSAPVVDMMPALILIMPFSALWSALMG